MKAMILAAGLGTRMRSRLPKMLHPVCGRPMLAYVIDAARQAIASPLLEVNIAGAQGILFNITGSSNLSLFEVTEVSPGSEKVRV